MLNKIFLRVSALVFLMSSCSDKPQSLPEFGNADSLQSPASAHSSEPYLFTQNNITYLSWLENVDTTTVFKISELKGETWSEPTTIASGSTWFVNWADYPTIAANGDDIIAHYLDERGPGKYSYDVKYQVSHDKKSWSAPMILNDDGKEAEHGFVSIVPYNDGFFASWLDGRNAAMEGDDHASHHGAMSLRGAVLDKNGNKLEEWLLDERVCDCCQTSAAITKSGPVVVYRDRSHDEVRDMSITKWDGKNWSKPESIYHDNWMINGCPVNGPRISASGDDVAIAWFSAPNDSTEVKIVFSNDGGRSFTRPVLINKSQTLGRVDIELIDSNTAAVSWIENDSIRIMKVDHDGNRSASRAIAKISSGRSSGFPQLTSDNGRLIMAWTDVEAMTVKAAVLSLN